MAARAQKAMRAQESEQEQEARVNEVQEQQIESEEENDEDEEDHEEGGASEVEEIELDLDKEGRPEGVVGRLNYAFTPVDDALKCDEEGLEALRRDCEKLHTAKEAESGERSEGTTFWIASNEWPQCDTERLAQSIFFAHAGSATYNASKSGAEFWAIELNADDDVGFHFDSDGHLEHEEGVAVHPHIATVTYLTGSGAPTVVVEGERPIFSDDSRAISCHGVHASWPSPRKHVSFDGRWLHGAPQLHQGGGEQRAEKRVTFLVNVWLNFTPTSCERMSDNLAASMERHGARFEAAGGEADLRISRFPQSGDLRLDRHFKVRRLDRRLRCNLPMSVLRVGNFSVSSLLGLLGSIE